jgi:hypothetical protein
MRYIIFFIFALATISTHGTICAMGFCAPNCTAWVDIAVSEFSDYEIVTPKECREE